MRTTVEENEALGKMIGSKLSKSKGPVAVYVPLKGVSAIDAPGQPFYDSEADLAFVRGLKAELKAEIPLIELNVHINDDAFAQAITEALDQMIAARSVK